MKILKEVCDFFEEGNHIKGARAIDKNLNRSDGEIDFDISKAEQYFKEVKDEQGKNN